MSDPKKKVTVIAGPTGSGKTRVGFELSKLLSCEFISADSMQIYKGMDIITDKLPATLRKTQAYHLLDVIDPAQEFDVAQYCRTAAANIRSIFDRNHHPIVIGGSGLYIDSLINGIFRKGDKDEDVRARLEGQANEWGLPAMYALLKESDPATALKISTNDRKRIIRALEVYQTQGQPISLLQQQRRGLRHKYHVSFFGIRWERAKLYARIDQRVDNMIQDGLIEEVRSLRLGSLSRTAAGCIGIPEISAYLDGRYGIAEATRLLKRNSRHLAKRQLTWFRRDKDIEWLDVAEERDLIDVARHIADKCFERESVWKKPSL